MAKLKLATEQLAQLLYKSWNEPRRNQKRFLKDLGGDGSAEELDKVLQIATGDAEATRQAEILEERRKQVAKTVEIGVDARVAEMLADIRVKMKELKLTQEDLAEACGWNQPLVAAYLTGQKEPGIGNLAKMATSLGCVWRLTPAAPG